MNIDANSIFFFGKLIGAMRHAKNYKTKFGKVLDGKITPKDESFNRIKELMFDVNDDLPAHASFPKVQPDMEIIQDQAE